MLLAGLLPEDLPVSGAQLQLRSLPADVAGQPGSSRIGLWRWPQTARGPCKPQSTVMQLITNTSRSRQNMKELSCKCYIYCESWGLES